MSAETKREVWGVCSADGCTRTASFFDGKCRFHSALFSAKWLTEDEAAQLREHLADPAFLHTPEQRRRARLESALHMQQYYAKQLEAGRQRCLEAGATQIQIDQAQATGAADALLRLGVNKEQAAESIAAHADEPEK